MYLYQKDKESILLETKETFYNSKANGRNTTRNRKKTGGIPYRIITSHPLHADSIQNTSAAAEPVAHPPVTVQDAPPPVMELHRFRDIGEKAPATWRRRQAYAPCSSYRPLFPPLYPPP